MRIENKINDFEERVGFYCSRAISSPLTPPEHVYFSLTNRCNLRCKMCDVSATPSRVEDELSTEKVKEIILQIKDLGIKHLILSGGEPLLRQDLLPIIEFSTSADIGMVDIITNGTLLNEDIIRQLIKFKLNHITVSLDGLRQTNDNIRGKDSFAASEENIDKLNFLKAEYNTPFPTLGINFTIMDNNVDDILPMVDFARSKRCNIIVFQPILFNNTKMYEKKKNILWPSRDNIKKLQPIIKKLVALKSALDDIYIYTDKKVLSALPGYFKGKRAGREFKCYEAIKRIVISYSGSIWSCQGIYGDLRKENLKEIWFSKKAGEIRSKAKVCAEHCLQDCVYFPSDVYEQAKTLIRDINESKDNDKTEMKKRISGKIDYYIGILSKNNKIGFLGALGCNDPARGLKALNLIKKEIDESS